MQTSLYDSANYATVAVQNICMSCQHSQDQCNKIHRAMAVNNRDTVVAQLAEWLFPAPEDPSSNPVIGNFSKQSITADCEEEKTKEKICRNCHLKRKFSP